MTGVREVNEQIGSIVAEARLPTIGAHKTDSYEGDGYVVVAHERTDVVKAALKLIVETVRVSYAE